MNSKKQEADRVRMERALRGAGYELERCLVDAERIAPYNERLAAWEAVVEHSMKAAALMRNYMHQYGLLTGEVE